MGNQNNDKLIKLAVVVTGFIVLIIILTLVTRNKSGDDSEVIQNNPTTIPTPTEAVVEDTDDDEEEFDELGESEIQEVKETLKKVLDIRYNGEYTEADRQFIQERFSDETFQSIDNFYSKIPSKSNTSDKDYISVENQYKQAYDKIESEKVRVARYPYKTYNDYLKGEFPEMFEERGDTVDSFVPEWYLLIGNFYESDNGEIVWEGYSAPEAEELGLLEYYLDVVYPSMTGNEADKREFNYNAYINGEYIDEEQKAPKEEALSEDEWYEKYKKADIPQLIYDDNDVVTTETGEHVVYLSSFQDGEYTKTVVIGGYAFEITRDRYNESNVSWQNTKGKDRFNMEITLWKQEKSASGGRADLIFTLYADIDNYYETNMKVIYYENGTIGLYGLGELQIMQ